MTCKNCHTPLKASQNYCDHCGAKVIRNRLTIATIATYMNQEYFDLDNKVIRTFLDLFKTPKNVIHGYISGMRRRYVDVIPYLAISLTLLGFQMYILLNFFPESMSENSYASGNAKIDELTADVTASILDYMGLLTVLTTPILALFTWIFHLDKPIYNYAEHIVINMYLTAQITITAFILFILTLPFSVSPVISFGIITVVTYIYIIYGFQRLYNVHVVSSLIRIVLAYVFYATVQMALLILVGVIYGALYPEKFIIN